MIFWRKKIGLVVLLFGLVLIWNHPSGHAVISNVTASQEANAHPSVQYFQVDDFSLGEFLPNTSAGSLANGLFSRDWSPNIQLRIFGVSVAAPSNFEACSHNYYFNIRRILLLPFERYDIGYPFHTYW